MPIWSFDVFDTLITRTFLGPADVFLVVGTDLAKICDGAFTPELYQAARQRAEHLARQQSKPREDCTFTGIFDWFSELDDWGVSRSNAMMAELDAERRLSRPISENLDRVRELRAAGERVIFISDMYLPAVFIAELLARNGLDCRVSDLFVSGDVGLTKRSGRLYLTVLSTLGVVPADLHHVGDNPLTDIQVPRSLGVKVSAYVRGQPTRYEQLRRPRGASRLWCSEVVGQARALRLAVGGDANGANVARIACNVIAPMLTAYVAWVLAEARRRRMTRLYFVSRDGQILYRIAGALRQRGDPELHYLYGSRQAWLLPSVLPGNLDCLDWAWNAGMSRRGDDVLRRLEIDTPEVHALLAAAGFEPARLRDWLDDHALQCLRSLLGKPPIAGLLMDVVGRRRRLAQAYLMAEGLLDSATWAIVDVGWRLQCQAALRRILGEVGEIRDIQGFYLGVLPTHLPLAISGLCFPFVTAHGSKLASPLRANWFLRSPTILLIEHLFTMADHPQVTGYEMADGRVQPVFGSDERTPKQIRLCGAIQDAALRYAGAVRSSAVIDPAGAEYRNYALRCMRGFCLRPSPDDVMDIGWLPTNREQSHSVEHIRRLAGALTAGDVVAMTWGQVSSRGTAAGATRFAWLAGSAALSPAPVRWVFWLLYRLNLGASRIAGVLRWAGLSGSR